MRILIRTSKWAIWARRFGALALPLAGLPVLLHREQWITSDNFQIIEAVALSLAAIATLAGLIAIARLWVTGDQGWGRALQAAAYDRAAADVERDRNCLPPALHRCLPC